MFVGKGLQFIDMMSNFEDEMIGKIKEVIVKNIPKEQFEQQFLPSRYDTIIEGEIGSLAQECVEIWECILKYGSKELEQEMFHWLLEHLNESIIDYMKEYLEALLFENFKEQSFLIQKLKFTDNRVSEFKKEEDSWSRGYSVERWAIKHLKVMEELNETKSSIDEYCEKHLEFSRVRKYYIERCINRGAFDKAINLLEEGKKTDKDWHVLVVNYSL